MSILARAILPVLLALPIAGWGETPSCTAPTYAQIKPPAYPPEAMRVHATGRTILLVAVGVDGVPRDISVQTSSGNVALDNAASEQVASWRFEPSRCGGVAVSKQVRVPVDFNLTDEDSGTSWEVAADTEPMEFATVAAELSYLQEKPDLEERSRPPVHVFSKRMSTWSWLVIESPTGSRAIMRTREQQIGNGYKGLYAFLCEGAEDWCSKTREDQIDFLKANPMPPAPAGFDDAPPTREEFPKVDESHARVSLAVVKFTGGKYLADFPECSSKKAICIDPAPFALTATVERQIYGPALPRDITVATTSHYGLESYDFTNLEPLLVLLVSDGRSIIMPRYNQTGFTTDSRGQWVISMKPNPIGWLPCEVSRHRTVVRDWSHPDAMAIAKDEFDVYGVDAHPDYFVISNDSAVPKYGLYLQDMAEVLRHLKNPKPKDFQCNNSGSKGSN